LDAKFFDGLVITFAVTGIVACEKDRGKFPPEKNCQWQTACLTGFARLTENSRLRAQAGFGRNQCGTLVQRYADSFIKLLLFVLPCRHQMEQTGSLEDALFPWFWNKRGGFSAMRKTCWRVSLMLFALFVVGEASSSAVHAATAASRKLGTVSGSVRDHKGNPLAGAVIQLLRDGANNVSKQTRTAADGSFTARILPGRYLLTALANGFNATTFNAVQVNPSDELIYRFNLEPIGQGRTVPEKRNDRNDRKWILRSTQNRRSIFQNNEGEDAIVAAVEDESQIGENDETAAQIAADESDWTGNSQNAHGVVETYTATSANPHTPAYTGTNFALSIPASKQLDLIFAGQLGTNSLARLETTGRFRAGTRHLFSATIGGADLPLALASTGDTGGAAPVAQASFFARSGRVGRARRCGCRTRSGLFALHRRERGGNV
jgi:hypothetical protein